MQKKSTMTQATGLLRLLAMGLVILLVASCGGGGEGTDDGGQEAVPSNQEADVSDAEGTDESQGVQWTDLSLNDVLAEAGETNKLVLVNVWSETCAQCGIMDQEIWNTPEGARLVGDNYAIKLHSDARENYDFRYKYPILGLPVALLLDSDGNEIDRVVGYVNKSRFLVEANSMMTGVDPLPDLEAQLESNPDNLMLYYPLMEKYLHRTREGDAQRLMDKILELDPNNENKEAEKAIRVMAKYNAFFHMDAAAAARHWRTLVERFPTSSAVTPGLKSTHELAVSEGTVFEWIDWICGLTQANPENGRFNSSVAMYAYRRDVSHPCLAEAGRTAKRLGTAPAGIDSIIVHLEGSSDN